MRFVPINEKGVRVNHEVLKSDVSSIELNKEINKLYEQQNHEQDTRETKSDLVVTYESYLSYLKGKRDGLSNAETLRKENQALMSECSNLHDVIEKQHTFINQHLEGITYAAE
ncbi:hypothetical protein [Staphylococcus sp. HMSC061G12]|uniref:hypothetical protein n=1 Tax=Staphylococcus sp. HMSC061G12 TaxID=1739441 RepID=UPI0008A9FCE5|nr:hypothetical protein [Staphylococcus sp. HMSC061G12]OHR54796.1 hypothetical protein HMPREF2937_10360 [Staphylococcus sp. HMSC061G12]